MEPKAPFAFPGVGLFADSRSGATVAPREAAAGPGDTVGISFSRAPRELVGRTHYCLACDGGRLPRPWAEGREVSGRKPEEDKTDSDREVNSG